MPAERGCIICIGVDVARERNRELLCMNVHSLRMLELSRTHDVAHARRQHCISFVELGEFEAIFVFNASI